MHQDQSGTSGGANGGQGAPAEVWADAQITGIAAVRQARTHWPPKRSRSHLLFTGCHTMNLAGLAVAPRAAARAGEAWVSLRLAILMRRC